MEKKAESGITVLEIVGERQFICKLKEEFIHESFNWQEFNLVLFISMTVGEMTSCIKEVTKDLKDLRVDYEYELSSSPDFAKKVIKAAEKFINSTKNTNDPNSIWNNFLTELESENMKYFNDIIENEFYHFEEEVSLLKKAAGL